MTVLDMPRVDASRRQNGQMREVGGCPYQGLEDIDRSVVSAAIAQLSERAIRSMAVETPELFYKWCVETYTAKRQAELEVEFQSALLQKLQRCETSTTSV